VGASASGAGRRGLRSSSLSQHEKIVQQQMQSNMGNLLTFAKCMYTPHNRKLSKSTTLKSGVCVWGVVVGGCPLQNHYSIVNDFLAEKTEQGKDDS
jgi:hypothetical protein